MLCLALRFHPAAGDDLAQHVTEVRPPIVHGRHPSLRVHHPFHRIAADGLGHFERPVGYEIAPLSLSPCGHLQQLVDHFQIPHSKRIPSVSSGPMSPFSQASNRTPAPKEK